MSGPPFEPRPSDAADGAADESDDAPRADAVPDDAVPDQAGPDERGAAPDILDRIDALLPDVGDERRGSIVPSADIWDDDVNEEVDDDEWLPDAQEVVHGPDGEPYGEPLDDPLYDGRSDPAMASRMARWGRDSAVGAGMAGFGRAIQNVLQSKESTEIVIQVDANRDNPDDPVTVHLVEDHPEESLAIVRPWLLGAPRRRRRHRADNTPRNVE